MKIVVLCCSNAIYMKFHFWKNRNFTDIIWTTLPGLVVKMIIWKLEDNHQFAYSFDNQTLVCFQPSFEGKIVFCQRREILPRKSGFLIFSSKIYKLSHSSGIGKSSNKCKTHPLLQLEVQQCFYGLTWKSENKRVIYLFATVNRNIIQA